MVSCIIRMLQDEEGATMIEYAIMASLIAAVCVAVVLSIGTKTNLLFAKCDDNWR